MQAVKQSRAFASLKHIASAEDNTTALASSPQNEYALVPVFDIAIATSLIPIVYTIIASVAVAPRVIRPLGEVIYAGLETVASFVRVHGAVPSTSVHMEDVAAVAVALDAPTLAQRDQIGEQYYYIRLRPGKNIDITNSATCDAISAYLAVLGGLDIYTGEEKAAEFAVNLHSIISGERRYFKDFDPYGGSNQYHHFHLGRKYANGTQVRDSDAHLLFSTNNAGFYPIGWFKRTGQYDYFKDYLF